MNTRLFPVYCEIYEWLYRVSWWLVPSLLKYTSGVKIRGLQSVQPCWQTTPNTYLIWQGKLFFLFSPQLCVSPTHRPRPYTTLPFAICLHHVLEVTEEAFLSQRCLPAWYVSRLCDWQATWTSQCVAQSGLAVGLLPSLCRQRLNSQLMSPGLRGRRTGPAAGSVRAALQRGAWHDALL